MDERIQTAHQVQSTDRSDFDDIAVERAIRGDGITLDQLTALEQEEAVRRLTANGASIRQIAETLAISPRTVSRRRRVIRRALQQS